ncbi:MAG: hypothetical protein QF535_09495, partial [Anaerolineales bacterium]|nr:hypothetical protein [Anaerolineales bacterium]
SRNGSTALTIDGSNNYVGIGVAPTAPLHVKSTATNTVARIAGGSSTSTFDLNIVGTNSPSNYSVAFKSQEAAGSGMAFYTRESGGTVSEQMVIKEDGNVGIGTNNPAHELTIDATATPQIQLNDTTNTANFRLYQTDSDASIFIGKSGAYSTSLQITTQDSVGNTGVRMTVTGSNVGIGTTGPDELLEIQGSGTDATNIHIDSGGHCTLKLDVGSSGYNSQILFDEADASQYAIYYQGNQNALVFYDHAGGSQDITIKGGNVGIGTGTPSFSANAKGLDIAGTGGQVDAAQDGTERIPTLRITDTVGNYGSGTATVGEKRGAIEWYSTEASHEMPGISAAIYNINENTYNTQFGTAFYTFNAATMGGDGLAERMRITYDGNVGIGTTSPGVALEVIGNVSGS